MQADTADMQSDNEPLNGHIDVERFATFDHEALTTDELAHLAGCAVCRSERQAHLTLSAIAAAARMPTAPDTPRLTSWESLASGLRREGLLSSPPEVSTEIPVTVHAVPLRAYGDVDDRSTSRVAPLVPSPAITHREDSRAGRGMPTWLRVAAAMLLTISGALAGRLSAGGSLIPDDGVTPSVARRTSATDAVGDSFATVQDATASLYRAQSDYERASLWLASNDTTSHSSDVYRARLAALDQMMASSRAALRDAPSDPILRHYFQSAFAAREATLKQLSIALPVDKTLERY